MKKDRRCCWTRWHGYPTFRGRLVWSARARRGGRSKRARLAWGWGSACAGTAPWPARGASTRRSTSSCSARARNGRPWCGSRRWRPMCPSWRRASVAGGTWYQRPKRYSWPRPSRAPWRPGSGRCIATRPHPHVAPRPRGSGWNGNSTSDAGSRATKQCIGRYERARLPAAPAQHDRHRSQHDPAILQRGLPADVLEVVSHLPPDVVHRAIVGLVDLGPAGDPRAHALTALIALDLLPPEDEDRRLLGTGSHDVHVAQQHVEQLRQLVEADLPQHAPDRRDARVVGPGPHLVVALRAVQVHRAELVHRERPAAEIDLAARVAAGTRQAAPVEPDPRLGEEHRAARCQLDQRGDDEHQGQRQDDPHHRRGDVEAAPAAPLAVDGSERRAMYERDAAPRDARLQRRRHDRAVWQTPCASMDRVPRR